jgi:hypothetical protein
LAHLAGVRRRHPPRWKEKEIARVKQAYQLSDDIFKRRLLKQFFVGRGFSRDIQCLKKIGL